jgi:hypothetical protein
MVNDASLLNQSKKPHISEFISSSSTHEHEEEEEINEMILDTIKAFPNEINCCERTKECNVTQSYFDFRPLNWELRS